MTTITSFAYRTKRTPRADVVIDCRGLPNPADQPWMRRLNGHDPRVADHVLPHPDAQRIVEAAVEQATLGATSIAVGCNAGTHRSVAIAEAIAARLDTTASHRDLAAPTHSWTSGGTSRTSTTAGRRFRRAVLRRDGYTCRSCGRHDPTGRSLEADHIVNVRAGGTDDPTNGQTLCIPCHAQKTRIEAQNGRRRNSTRRPRESHPGLLRRS